MINPPPLLFYILTCALSCALLAYAFDRVMRGLARRPASIPRSAAPHWSADAPDEAAPPPDGVCIARATDALAEGTTPIKIRCPYHGVDPGKRCPSQSPMPVQDALAEIDKTMAELGVKDEPAPAKPLPPLPPQYIAARQMWGRRVPCGAGCLDWKCARIATRTVNGEPRCETCGSMGHDPHNDAGATIGPFDNLLKIEIVEHDNTRANEVWLVRDIAPGTAPDVWLSTEQVRADWPEWIGWLAKIVAPTPAESEGAS